MTRISSRISDFLSFIVPTADNLLILGDFNIHICCPSKPLVKQFSDLVDSFNLIQSVCDATHRHGHTLDLVLSWGLSVSNVCVVDNCISDHSSVIFHFDLPSVISKNKSAVRCVRPVNETTANCFAEAYAANSMSSIIEVSGSSLNTEELTTVFNSVCLDILNDVAPLRYKRYKPQSQPWLNNEICGFRRACRKAERRWRRDRLQISYELLKDTLRTYQHAVKAARTKYFSDLINRTAHCPKVLFSTINTVLNPSIAPLLDSTLYTCEDFLNFFVSKIEHIRKDIVPSSIVLEVPMLSSCIFDSFDHVSLPCLANLVKNIKPSFTSLDAVPPQFLKAGFKTMGPSILSIVNSSLSNGSVPSCLKHAVVSPLLKKPSLAATELINFRPISKLPFLSKVIEKVVFSQIAPFLSMNALLDEFQSGFRAGHSTETALVKVLNDLFLASDSGRAVVLIMLDLSAAFDTVDHSILLKRLECEVGFRGSALKWFHSYLKDRTFSVNFANVSSSVVPLKYGLPQGSILSPILFSLYMRPLGSICRRYDISYHMYADDTQIYFPLKVGDEQSLQSLLLCLNEIKIWLSNNFLQLNERKSEIIIFGPSNFKERVVSILAPLEMTVKDNVRNLGVIIDSSLSFDKQINSVVRSSFYHLKIIAKLKPFLSFNDLETVVHAFISSRLDYCNSLYVGISHQQLSRLQLVQNAAARLLTGTKKREHITPVLCSLHWLPVKFRIDFKILLVVFKALHNLSPNYISNLIKPYISARSLRSSNQLLLVTPQSKKKSKGDRAFSVAGPKLWNNLPLYIRQAPSVEVFRSQLKTYLFSLAF